MNKSELSGFSAVEKELSAQLTEGLSEPVSANGKMHVLTLCPTLAAQPLRHSVPPPLTQGRLGDFASCHLFLHRGRLEDAAKSQGRLVGQVAQLWS